MFGLVALASCTTLPDRSAETLSVVSTDTTTCEDVVPKIDTKPADGPLQTQEAPDPKPSQSPKTITYPTLTYGDPLPFVCHEPIQADDALSERPNLQIMWENYIHDRPGGVWGEVGGLVEYNGLLPEEKGGWRNACAVRMSYMLNKASFSLPHIDGKTVSGANGNHYFFRLEDLQNYLLEKMGPADFEYNHGPSRWQELPAHPGILIQRYPGSNFTGHATIWNGAGTVDDADIGGYRILFWNVPCFQPVDRIVSNNGNDK